MYFVYLIECKDGSIYTGITLDVSRRFREHKEGVGARYTAGRGVKRLLHTEKYPDRSLALKREAEIKKWPRRKKIKLFRRKA